MVDLSKAMDALRLAAIGCTGFSLLQADDSSTWVFFGVSDGNRATAVGIVQDLIAGPAVPSSQFWPSSLEQLQADLERVKEKVGLSA